jgi:hypothetical protein
MKAELASERSIPLVKGCLCHHLLLGIEQHDGFFLDEYGRIVHG